MTAFIEPLPGLLDDPLLHLPDLPPRADVRIPPLRDPFPSRTLSVPSPLEPNAPGDKQTQGGVKLGGSKNASRTQRTTPKVTPADVISARDATKPNLAISALVDSTSTNVLPRLLPPSFVNLAAVENNAFYPAWPLDDSPSKRLRLDQEYHGDYVQLPKPRQKETKRVPLLPTIVNGIHEPPANAPLLPPMEAEEVKAMLAGMSETLHLPPEKMLNSPGMELPDIRDQEISKPMALNGGAGKERVISTQTNDKRSRTWRKWSHDETEQLLKGVAKHGAGKWRQICDDPEFKFRERKPMDLKDRFRICIPSPSRAKNEVPSSWQFDGSSSMPPCNTPSASTDLKPWQARRTSSSTLSGPAPNTPNPLANPDEGPLPSPIHNQSQTDLTAVALKSRTTQRVRKLWTEEEHQNLVKGFAKHGYQWTAIRNDTELNLSHRKATDIRDKFRSLFPQQYMDAETGPPMRKKSMVGDAAPQNGSLPGLGAASSSRMGVARGAGDKRGQNLGPVSMPVTLLKPMTRPEDLSKDTHGLLENPQEVSSAPNLTLPPLTLGDNDWDWDDNKLAPLLDWEEFGL